MIHLGKKCFKRENNLSVKGFRKKHFQLTSDSSLKYCFDYRYQIKIVTGFDLGNIGTLS